MQCRPPPSRFRPHCWEHGRDCCCLAQFIRIFGMAFAFLVVGQFQHFSARNGRNLEAANAQIVALAIAAVGMDDKTGG
jgi:hypothetical protein